MSFHFQPQADSSDEEEAVDISAWKSGAVAATAAQEQAPSPPEAAIQVMDELASALNDPEEQDEIAPFQGDLDGAADVADSQEEDEDEEQEEPTFQSSGFTSVNKPARIQAEISLPESSDDEAVSPSQLKLPNRTRQAAGPSQAARMLVPVIPRLELSSSEAEDIIDFTAGDDVVRRVKKEVNGRGGDVVYLVEFEDRHVEEVSYFVIS